MSRAQRLSGKFHGKKHQRASQATPSSTAPTELPRVGPFAVLPFTPIAGLSDHTDDGDEQITTSISTPVTYKTYTISGSLEAGPSIANGNPPLSSGYIWVNKFVLASTAFVSFPAQGGENASFNAGGSGGYGASGGGGGAQATFTDPGTPSIPGGTGGQAGDGNNGGTDGSGSPGGGGLSDGGGNAYGGFASGADVGENLGGPGYGAGGNGGGADDAVIIDSITVAGGGGGGGAGVFCVVANEILINSSAIILIPAGGGGQPNGDGGNAGQSGGAGVLHLMCRKWTASVFSQDGFNAMKLIEISGPVGNEILTDHGNVTNISFNNL